MNEGAQIMISRRGLFYGWIVVVTSAVGLLLGAFPIVAFSFGVFFRSYAEEFNAGRAAISFAFTIPNLLSGIFAVVVARIADRVGARKVILPGLAIVAAMLISAEAIGSRVWELYCSTRPWLLWPRRRRRFRTRLWSRAGSTDAEDSRSAG